MARTGWMQGFYKPNHPEKVLGKVEDLFYRSSYELALFNFLDNTPEIIRWGSEKIVIPYLDAGTLNEFGHPKQRRYYTDIVALVKKADGSRKVALIEVKPKSQTVKPRKTTRTTEKTYQTAMKTYLTNISKWEAARKYCLEKGWEFLILTENEIFPNQGKIKNIKKVNIKKNVK